MVFIRWALTSSLSIHTIVSEVAHELEKAQIGNRLSHDVASADHWVAEEHAKLLLLKVFLRNLFEELVLELLDKF